MRGRGVIILVVLFAQLAFCCAQANATSDDSLSVAVPELGDWIVSNTHANTLKLPIFVTTTNQGGYSVKMQTVGVSTDLVSRSDSDLRIPTVLPPGEQTTVPLNALDNTYGVSLDGTNFWPVPETHGDGMVIFENAEPLLNKVNEHDLTFGLVVDDSVPASRYENTFLITVVANDSVTCDPGYVCYEANNEESTGGATKQQEVKTENKQMNLLAPSFAREGYGFAGWNTRRDGTGTNYGPNETIDTEAASDGLVLYAKWIKSEGSLQDWKGCEAIPIGGITALTDTRDGNTYAVARLPDGGCWMTENLRLDLSKSGSEITAENTNNPTTEFLKAVNENPSSSDSFCTDNSQKCVNSVRFNSRNIDPESEDYWSSYGGYYNWYTATAGNGTLSNKEPRYMVAGDICPAGWSLPTGYGDTGDLAQLDIALGGSGKNQDVSSEWWRKYPTNFVFSGEFNGTQVLTINETGNYHAANPSTNIYAMNLWMRLTSVRFNSNGGSKTRGDTVRCVFNKHYKVHFDKNTDKEVTGQMPDFGVSTGVEAELPANALAIAAQGGVNYRFANWNTAADGSGESYDDADKIYNLVAAGETVTLYAQWEEYSLSNVTINFGTPGIGKVEFSSDDYGSFEATESGSVVTMANGKTYRILSDMESDYEFVSWETTANGILGSDAANPTTFSVNGEAELTISAQVRTTKLYLQNVTLSDCSSSVKIAYDIRDEEPYYIQRLADGRCWMVDNLRITGSHLDVPLTTENTNMSPDVDFVLPESGVITNTYGTPMLNDTNKDEKPLSYGNGGDTVGVYYNYCAATAGTVCAKETPDAAEYDICPAGWRLPTGGNGTGELVNLYSSYNNSATALRPGFSVVFGGWYEAATGKVKDYDNLTYIWSSTPSNTFNKSFALMSNRSSVNASFGALETNGLSMRCILKPAQ